jgi:8-oxo-dGTP diphosphatase
MGQQDQGVSDSTGRYTAVLRTLCFVTHGDDVLLLKGAPDKRLWANRYNGVGGHVERDEDVYAAAVREICEETGWRENQVDGLALRALITVDAGDPNVGIPNVGIMLFVFTACARSRQTRASAEGTLEWIARSQLQDYALVEDLPVLLPRVLSVPDGAPPLFAHYSYDQDDQLVMNFHVSHLPGVP